METASNMANEEIEIPRDQQDNTGGVMKTGDKATIKNTTLDGKVINEGIAVLVKHIKDDLWEVLFKVDGVNDGVYRRRVQPEDIIK